MIRNAYGTSIPHLDPVSVEQIPFDRLSKELENEITDRMEQASELYAETDDGEDELAADVDKVITDLIAS